MSVSNGCRRVSVHSSLACLERMRWAKKGGHARVCPYARARPNIFYRCAWYKNTHKSSMSASSVSERERVPPMTTRFLMAEARGVAEKCLQPMETPSVISRNPDLCAEPYQPGRVGRQGARRQKGVCGSRRGEERTCRPRGRGRRRELCAAWWSGWGRNLSETKGSKYQRYDSSTRRYASQETATCRVSQ